MDFEYSRDEYKCEERKGSILMRGSSFQNGEHFLAGGVAPHLVTEISSLVRENLENECGVFPHPP